MSAAEEPLGHPHTRFTMLRLTVLIAVADKLNLVPGKFKPIPENPQHS